MELVPIQQEFCPEPQKVQGNVDYANFERMLKRVDELLVQGGVERDVVDRSIRLAECPLYRWFCRIENFGPIRVPSKSTLQDLGQWLPEEEQRFWRSN
jgi:hypothetical protein